MSVSLGRNLQNKPLVCHDVPHVILFLSKRTAFMPLLDSWYKVLQPMLPPPGE